MIREVFRWSSLASTIAPLIPLILLFIYRKGQPRQNLVLSIALFLSFAFDVTGYIMSYHLKKSTILLFNIYCIVAFPAIMAFYHEILIKRFTKIFIPLLTAAFFLTAITVATDQGMNVANNITWSLSSVLITAVSFLFVAGLRLMDDSTFSKNQFHVTNIIINSSLGIYYFVTVIFFAARTYIFSHFSPDDIRYFWIFHNALNMLKNFGIAVAFYLSAKTIAELSKKRKQII